MKTIWSTMRLPTNLGPRTYCRKTQKTVRRTNYHVKAVASLQAEPIWAQYKHTSNNSSHKEAEHIAHAEKSEDSGKRVEPLEKQKSIAEKDNMLMNAWKDREGSLANSQFEDGKVEEGYRRHVVRFFSAIELEP
jgi:hypothetical protein